MIYLLSFLFALLPSIISTQPPVGQTLPDLTLSGKTGGRVDGSNWRSTELKGKVITVMYVDPDEKDMNEHVERALKKENFPRDKYGSVAIVNAAATWKPDSMIRMVLKNKQKDYPDTIYVMDRDKVLVKKWRLADNNYHVLTFDKSGRLLYEKAGKMTESDIRELVRQIRSHI